MTLLLFSSLLAAYMIQQNINIIQISFLISPLTVSKAVPLPVVMDVVTAVGRHVVVTGGSVLSFTTVVYPVHGECALIHIDGGQDEFLWFL